MRDTTDKINRKMTGLEKTFSKPKMNRPFKSNLYKELQQTKKKDSNPKERETKGKIDNFQKGKLEWIQKMLKLISNQ